VLKAIHATGNVATGHSNQLLGPATTSTTTLNSKAHASALSMFSTGQAGNSKSCGEVGSERATGGMPRVVQTVPGGKGHVSQTRG